MSGNHDAASNHMVAGMTQDATLEHIILGYSQLYWDKEDALMKNKELYNLLVKSEEGRIAAERQLELRIAEVASLRLTLDERRKQTAMQIAETRTKRTKQHARNTSKNTSGS